MLRTLLLITVMLVGAGCATGRDTLTNGDGAPAAGRTSLTTSDGAFTAEQAERGKRVYDTYCFNCHPAQFYEARLPVWVNGTVGRLFDVMASTMPEENPGSLSTAEYLDVLAYIFSITGSPTGDTELTTSNMGAIAIVSE